MKLAPVIRRPPGSNVSPSSNHCQSCDWTFFSEESYQHHQETVHKIDIPKSQRSTSSSNILPDIHDPNFYCKPCQHAYKSLQIYRSHLKRIHNMNLTPLVKKTMYDPTVSADVLKDPKNTSCPICKCTYSNRNKYRRHMATIHKDGKNTPVCRKETINSSNIQPDPNDPNLHCAACQRVYSNRQVFRHHLRLQHPNVKMDQIKGGVQSTISPIMAEMDAGNPNNTWCNICRRNYATRVNYRNHVNRVHKGGKREPAAKGGIQHRSNYSNPLIVETDAGDPTNKKCTICDWEYSHRDNYLAHMNTVHKDGKRAPVVRRSAKARNNSGVIPIWSDPSNYCQSCQRQYSSNKTYKQHIREIHGDVLHISKQLSMPST